MDDRKTTEIEFRLYADDELGKDGYPAEWHRTIKHAVRADAGHRCVRCGHPYKNGEHGNGEWTPCDGLCTHATFEDVPLVDLGAKAIYRVEGGRTEARWRILTVHHLDGNKANCRWWNLVALCQRCHLTIQGRVKMERVYPWAHTPWFKPYVAGFYAFIYLGEDLTREQVDDRLDELLGLELIA